MKIFTATEARQNFQEIIDSVYYRNESVIIVRRNKPRVVISPLPKDDKKIDKAIKEHERISEETNL